MATGSYDENGFYTYGEDDLADPGAGFSELLNKSAEGVRNAVPVLVHNQVVEEIASYPTFLEAADEAVDESLSGAGVLYGVDSVSTVPGVSIFATDSGRRQSALGIDENGYPTDAALDMFGTKQGIKVYRGEPIDGWTLIHCDAARRIGWGIRSDGTFWAPGVPYVGTQQPPQTPAGLVGLWFYPNPDGSFTVRSEQGATP